LTKRRAPSGKKRRELIYDALLDAKAQDIVALDVRKVSDFADYLFVASGTSTRHVASIADKVEEKLAAHGVKASGSEGHDVGDWVLIDYGDIVVHVMRPQTRDFYNLEKLWSEGKRVKMTSAES
jgi:ribosome-associated protein